MKKRVLVAIVIAVVFGLLVIGGIVFANHWFKPLGKELGLATRTPTLMIQPTEAPATPTPELSAPTLELPTATAVLTATAKPLACNSKAPVLYFLVIGADAPAEAISSGFGLSDVMRIVRIDFTQPKVSVLTLPRDLWVQFPNTDQSIPGRCPMEGKLNQAFFLGNVGKKCYLGLGEGPGSLAETLATNYDLYNDHYVVINETIFKDLIDAIGGIDLYLEEAVDGRPIDEESFDLDKSQGFFNEGWNHLTGKDALSFVRIRDRYTEIKRSDNQTLLLCGLKDKMTRPEVILKIPKIINAVMSNTQTDLSPAEISTYLTCLLPQLNSDNLQFVRFPDEWFAKSRQTMVNGEFVWDISQEEIKTYLAQFQNDQIPMQENLESSKGCPVPPEK